MSEDFINGLVATAEPVQRRRVGLEALAVLAVGGIEFIGLTYFFDPAIAAAAFNASPVAMTAKVALFGLLALASMGLALLSLDPAAKRIETGAIALLTTMLVLSVGFFDFRIGPTLEQTIHPMTGMHCTIAVTSLALPVTLVMGMLMMSGASTQPRRSAFLAGLAGGAFGAFVFSLQCPHTSFYYLALWYGGGIGIVSLLSIALMPRFMRW